MHFENEVNHVLFSFHFTLSPLSLDIHHPLTRENLICEHFTQTKKNWAHFSRPNIYGSFYSGHFLLELLKSALKSFPSSLHHLGLNWIFCRVHFSPVYACYELPCVSWEDRIKGNFSSEFIWRDKRIWGGATSSGRLSCPEQTSLINPPHSATPSCCSRPRPIIQTAQKRHKCFTSGHFDQKAINPNQQEDRN